MEWLLISILHPVSLFVWERQRPPAYMLSPASLVLLSPPPPPFYSALFNITHSSLSRPPSNPHSWDVVVSVTPSAMCEGSLAQLSLNKWNQSQKQLAPGEGGGFGNIPGGSGRKYWWDAVGMWACVCVFMSICVCLCACMCGWLMVEGLISWALDCSRSSPQ